MLETIYSADHTPPLLNRPHFCQFHTQFIKIFHLKKETIACLLLWSVIVSEWKLKWILGLSDMHEFSVWFLKRTLCEMFSRQLKVTGYVSQLLKFCANLFAIIPWKDATYYTWVWVELIEKSPFYSLSWIKPV